MNNFDAYNFKDKKALVRVDFNVPLTSNDNDAQRTVTDNTRIASALPTIKKILSNGGAVVLMSHLGRPKGEASSKFSLNNVVSEVEKLLGKKISFSKDCIGDETKQAVANLKAGEVLLLENLRFHPEEKKGDETFAKALADLGCDVYVNDAFGTAHRAHASTSVVAQYFDKNNILPGLLISKEVANGSKVLNSAQKPFTAILGGAKVSDKIQLIENLMEKADNILIGGAMAYTFIKAKGGKVGKSLVEEDKLELARTLLSKAKENNTNLLLPEDSIIADNFDNNANRKELKSDAIPDDWMGLDIGKKARDAYHDVIVKSKTILWNGPMGVFEMENFKKGTQSIAFSVAIASDWYDAYTMIGGGDSVSAIKQSGFQEKVSFISTGGGAMLEFFEGKDLPGIKALG